MRTLFAFDITYLSDSSTVRLEWEGHGNVPLDGCLPCVLTFTLGKSDFQLSEFFKILLRFESLGVFCLGRSYHDCSRVHSDMY